MKCRLPMKHRPKMEGVISCKQCERMRCKMCGGGGMFIHMACPNCKGLGIRRDNNEK